MKNTPLNANGLPLLIGSIPVNDPQLALDDWILKSTPEIPIWPQLPANPFERMLNQFTEGIPGIIEENIESGDFHIYYDTNGEQFPKEQLAFFEDYLTVTEDSDLLLDSRFATSAQRAQGIYTLTKSCPDFKNPSALKGQITGPFTMLTGVHDKDDRLGYYNPEIRDIIVKALAMKAAWQVKFLGQGNNLPVIVFIDEPALAGMGSSSFVSISINDVQDDINEIAAAIHNVEGMCGVHVCANTEWNLLLDSDIDILSFDAHGYFDRLALLKDKVCSFLDRGSILAWGIVPTGDHDTIRAETTDSLVELWESQAEKLTSPERTKKDILSQTFITPSCGTGALPQDLARKVLDLTRDVSAALRANYEL